MSQVRRDFCSFPLPSTFFFSLCIFYCLIPSKCLKTTIRRKDSTRKRMGRITNKVKLRRINRLMVAQSISVQDCIDLCFSNSF